MSFKELNLQEDEFGTLSYTESERTIIEFHKPVTAKTIKYKRIAGYFSSAVFSVLKDSLASFIQQEDSKIELITSHVIMKSDYDVMTEEERRENTESIISDEIINDIESLSEKISTDHLTVLDWLLQTGKLEIKIAVLEKQPGQSIMHRKLGCVEDKDGNRISFSGSENWSKKALLYNSENLDVFRSWVWHERGKIKTHFKQFQEVWENKDKTLETYAFPEAVKKKLIQFSAKTEEDAENAAKRVADHHSNTRTEPETNKKELYDYQKEALDKWKTKGDYKGIFAMATGTGKTFTAIQGMQRLIESNKKLVTIIVAPYEHICAQWEKELFDLYEYLPVNAYKNSKKWIPELQKKIDSLNDGFINNIFVVTTYNTYRNHMFINKISEINTEECPILIICDEVHFSGAEKFQEGLLDDYQYRLGLSATPERWLDPEGTEKITSYFFSEVYEYTLKQAIEAGFLTKYEYHIHPIDLTREELIKFKKITSLIHIIQNTEPFNEEKLLEAYRNRSKIIQNASEKFGALENILNENPDISKCLIFCSDKQIDSISELLREKFSNLNFRRFTHEEDTDEREEIIRDIQNGRLNIVLAMRCLDEGIDLPNIETAIITASSGNPKQYIQRRGRVLRKHKEKKYATIHDLIVMPDLYDLDDEQQRDSARQIMQKELRRYKEFASTAKHSSDLFLKIKQLEEQKGYSS